MTIANEPHTTNPLLERSRIPGEIHRLPSRGIFYTNGELDSGVRDGELQIFPMTLIDEITMKSPDLLFSGDAIKQVLARCVPQVMKPEHLLSKDVDFLMLVIRKASYGDLEINYKHICKDAKEHSYIIPVDNMIKSARSIDPTLVGTKFTVNLPNEMIVKVAPLKFQTVMDMLQLNDSNLTPEESRDIAIKSLLDIIISVDEITDKAMIKEWLGTINVQWTKLIDDAITAAQNDWGAEMAHTFKCKDCGEDVETVLPMNPLAFFI